MILGSRSELEEARRRVEDALREETELYDSLGDPIEEWSWIVAVIFSALEAPSEPDAT
jgi:hypothetical protein